jgi:hypothetical protein
MLTNILITIKLEISKQYAHKHGAWDQEHTKVFVTHKTYKLAIMN